MKILGLGGLDHNGSAAIVDGGRVAFLEAERVTRIKNVGLRDPTVLAALLARLQVNRVDAIAIADQTFWSARHEALSPVLRTLGDVPLKTYSHHDCHAACALAASPWDGALCVVFDGKGDGLSTSAMAMSRSGGLRRLLQVASAHSLGRLWWGVSQFCGFAGHHSAGKVMALAAYGRPVELFDEHLELEATGGFRIEPRAEHNDTFRQVPRIVAWLSRRLGCPPGRPNADAAAAVQTLTERVVAHVVASAVQTSQQNHVCLSGGVALNGLANQRLLASSVVSQLYVPPCTDDRGLALGAAALAAWELGTPLHPTPGGLSAFLGPQPQSSAPTAWRATSEDPKIVVDALVAGHPVANFEGCDEAGPRALGHRSILAAPAGRGARDQMNQLKGREAFRPFGCTIKADVVRDWFELEGDSPYMLRIAPIRPERAALVPGILHVDGTSRIQTARPDDGSGLWTLLDALERAGHPPILLNTSLNRRGEPLAHTVDDAAEIAASLGISHLVVGGVSHVPR